MFEWDFRTVYYYDADGNICGTEIQVRTRTVAILVGVLDFGAWGSWSVMPSIDITV